MHVACCQPSRFCRTVGFCRTLGLVLGCGFLWLSACATNPVTGRNELSFLSVEDEVHVGRIQLMETVVQNGGDLRSARDLQVYVNEVGSKIAAVSDRPDLPYFFVVIDNEAPNAWSMAGGQVCITRGLLLELEDESQLAAVLAHEIGHVAARHPAKAVERERINHWVTMGAVMGAVLTGPAAVFVVPAVAGGLQLGTGLSAALGGEGREIEADHAAMLYLDRAGYDPHAAIEVHLLLARHGLRNADWEETPLLRHPSTRDRHEAQKRLAGTLTEEGVPERRGESEFAARTRRLQARHAAQQAYLGGRQALAQGDGDGALEFSRRATVLNPLESRYFVLRGDALAASGRYAEAVTAYDVAIAGEPRHFSAHLRRGLAKEALGERGAARRDVEFAQMLLSTQEGSAALERLRLPAVASPPPVTPENATARLSRAVANPSASACPAATGTASGEPDLSAADPECQGLE